MLRGWIILIGFRTVHHNSYRNWFCIPETVVSRELPPLSLLASPSRH